MRRFCHSLLVFGLALGTFVNSADLLQAQRRGPGSRPTRQRPAADAPATSAEAPKTEKKAEKPKKITPTLSQSAADSVKWRSIGPANMGGRITALTVYEKDPSIWWAATASGGLLKTTNNGNTFEHQFDDQATVSIGDVQVAQSNKDIVWVGTGESNPRNSVSWGDGVYKSTDGGKTWKNMGLKKIFQTGALAIHPDNPDVVWIGALGRLWGPNAERGLYKTTDGGKTWKKVLYINDQTGVIDVQLNPKNPDEMLVATYERLRDGFDGNDPVKKYGSGAGIYKSTDGGESFMKVTDGLPTCKLGRIGLDYFESDPNVVVAVIESEKIAQEPENYSYLGIRGENADVGARLTSVTDDGPADKSGLKEGDIVVSINKNLIASYDEFLKEVHKYQAGETVDMVVSRERKLVDLKVELGKRENTGSSRRNDFTGTLGGQSANRQETQGPEGYQYGGIYLSEDGGDSWKRINTLNPRPMYYSNIQIDPIDRNNIYVCGTSLYKSSDGGKTFTGDGGTDGIHVDHHALWIDKRDPRHMILGNDGGIYITQDRMTHWDHYNHVAIGQFYHVGVDASLDYKVYGGLQDNGSWGGPSRGTSGGPVNTDWMRVGGGDGFVTLVDPEDKDQIYFESQNGAMGRIHLETGERGFLRPRERGKRFRFNWKTPFILSPHNSRMHYSAGNYVFRSFNKGDNMKRISEMITNTDKGAGSAISESPLEAGVLYVGTTDGAVWMTKDGGANWMPLFYTPEKKEEAKEEKSENSEAKSEEPAKKETEKGDATSSPSDQPASSDDPVSGAWVGKMLDDRIPEDRAEFNFTLTLKNGKVGGSIEGRRGTQDISSGKYNSETGAISWVIESDRGAREYEGKLKDGAITGEMSIGDGRFQMDFEAKKAKKDPLQVTAFSPMSIVLGKLTSNFSDDKIEGQWEAIIEDENVPGGRLPFTITIKMKGKKPTGQISSVMGDLTITDGSFNSEKGRLLFDAESEEFAIEVECDVEGDTINGLMLVNNGEVELEFKANRKQVKAESKPDAEAKQKPASEKQAAAKTPKAESDSKKPEATTKEESSDDDPVTGKWSGMMMSPGGERDISLDLKMKPNGAVSGTMETSQGEREVTGTMNKETDTLTLTAETDQFTLEIKGKVSGNNYNGVIDINDGAFSMDIEVARKSTDTSVTEVKEAPDKTEEPARPTAEAPSGENSLAKLMPGPRWVSSLEASRFKAGRCYATFDGHRSNDDGVHVFVTNDYGQTWESIQANIPDTAGSCRVIREDVQNENLLFLGCEFSSWYSIDGGKSWTRIKGGLPTVAVHEFAIHPVAGEVVAGTHGRSLWIADISILRQLTPERMAEDVVLFDSKPAIRWQRGMQRGSSGTRKFVGENPNTGTVIAYSLGKTARNVELVIKDVRGEVIKTFEADRTKGLHTYQWDLTGGVAGQRRSRQSVASGKYLIHLKVDGQLKTGEVEVKIQPGLSSAAAEELEKQLNYEGFERFFQDED